jgi:hypothetical protein
MEIGEDGGGSGSWRWDGQVRLEPARESSGTAAKSSPMARDFFFFR